MKIKSPTLPITAEPVLTIYSYFSARLRIRPYRGLRIQPAGAWQLPHLPGIELLTGHSAGADARKVCFVCLLGAVCMSFVCRLGVFCHTFLKNCSKIFKKK